MKSCNGPVGKAGFHPFLAVLKPGEPIPGRDGARLYAYTGTSMFPTLRALDFIEVQPLRGGIRRGDVILFAPPEECGLAGGECEQLVVHRVVEALPNGVRTRGDNNPSDDPWLVQPGQIAGRVIAARRGAQTIPLTGGRYGLARLFGQKALLKILGRLRRVRVGGGRARRWQPLSRLALAWLRPRRVVFASPRGPVTRLLAGRKVIGEYSPLEQRWRIRAPYRLLIDEGGLPGAAE